MSDNIKPENELDDALSSLRDAFEETAVNLETQPEPKQGKELRGWHFPKAVSYTMGVAAILLLVLAVYLFNVDNNNTPTADEFPIAAETFVDPETGKPIPTPPLLTEPPLPQEAIPLPPEPTPWPTPPIAPDESG